jgi:hypothetical protein
MRRMIPPPRGLHVGVTGLGCLVRPRTADDADGLADRPRRVDSVCPAFLSPRAYPVRVDALIDGCEAFDFAFARGFRSARIRRKLQHCGGLADAKPCQQHHLSTRKFQCIVVFVGAM